MIFSTEQVGYLQFLYDKFLHNPQEIPEDWQELFSSFSAEVTNGISIEKNLIDKNLITRDEVYDFLFASIDPLGMANPVQGGRKVASDISVEYSHIYDTEKRQFLRQQFAKFQKRTLSANHKRAILKHIIQAEGFEKFLHVKYPGAKRFSLEGAESLVPGIEHILHLAAARKMEDVVFAMAHRGRLSILALIVHKPFSHIFVRFQGDALLHDMVHGSGDVKYHLGYSNDRTIGDHSLHLSMSSNPSHLEAVTPIVVGRAKGKQSFKEDHGEKVLPIIMHGDAAFIGQGIVAETLQLSLLKGYNVGGSIHIIVNNQIGFTTSPSEARSSNYASEIIKVVQAPVWRVNADDPIAVINAMEMAFEYRQKFKSDVLVDFMCYRRYGHNEADDPSFTQPLMYEKIRNHLSVGKIYGNKLIAENIVTETEIKDEETTFKEILQKEFDIAQNIEEVKSSWLEGAWKGVQADIWELECNFTAVERQKLQEIGKKLNTIPDHFNAHPRLVKVLNDRYKNIENGTGLDWATCESLALASLLVEGTPIRFTGQDVGRGTFSQRHALWVDQKNQAPYIPFNNLASNQEKLNIINSPLSEAAVLGFEYGYSTTCPHTLVMWEAQFGDFANGAQVIIDQFLASGETKWLRLSGLVMLLPHGWEGQGPEHSSARLERYLQLCADHNMQVANCSTPANYFHILRRQVKSLGRKPLILMTPKSLLRNPLATSKIADLEGGFESVIDDTIENPDKIILCSGKVYYDLLQERMKRKINNIALIRLEQFYPFPEKQFLRIMEKYDAPIYWCQEEPQNMGAWWFLRDKLYDYLTKFSGYIGRQAAASPATGDFNRHLAEQNHIINQSLTL